MAKKLQIFGKFPSSGEVDSSEVERLVDKYLVENPPVPQFTINGESSDENGNYTINGIVDVTLTAEDDSGEEPGGEPGDNEDFVIVNTLNNSNDTAVLF